MLTAIALSVALLAGGAPAAPTLQSQSCMTDAPAAVPVATGDIGALSFCGASATCGLKPDVDCEDNTNPAECKGVDTDCSTGTIGYVECNGVRTSCPSDSCDCSDVCCNGNIRILPSSNCCTLDSGGDGEVKTKEECIDGQWEVVSTFCGPTFGCPPH